MLEAINALGKYEIAKEGLNDIDPFIEKGSLQDTKKVICIVFKKNGEDIAYEHIHIEDFKSSEYKNYLYRSHQSKRFDITPTTKIGYDSKNKKPKKEEDFERALERAFKRFQYWFDKFMCKKENKKYLQNEQVKFLNQLKESVSKNNNKIWEDLKEKSKELKEDEKKNSILTLKIYENGKEKYIGEFEVFKKILKEEGLRYIYYRHNVEIKGEGICCLCGEKKEVYDYFPFKFYTVDKRGFAPEFIQKDSWKRLSVCGDCLPNLMIGGDFLDNYLMKQFYQGYHFYFIPHFINGEIDEQIIKEIKRQERREDYEGLLIENDFFLEPIKKEREIALNLIFMFIEPKQGGNFNIARYVEDVPPSWIKKLDNALGTVRNLEIFKEENLKKIGVLDKKGSGDLKPPLGRLVETFFPHSKETGVYSKYFIDIIGDILAQRPINRDFLMKAFMREIRNKHVHGDVWNEKVLVLKSLMLLLFLDKLNLIKGKR